MTAEVRRDGKLQKASERRRRWLHADQRAETPVVSGRLKRGWRTTIMGAFRYKATNATRYAAAVDVKGKSKGYVRRGVNRWKRRVERA